MSRDWRAWAVCRDVDPELFFPVGTESVAQIGAAKAVCGRCRVGGECLAFALEHLPEGIAGGLSAEERDPRRAAHWRGQFSEAAAVARRGWGQSARVIARELGVSERTVQRWLRGDRGRAEVA